MKRIHSIPSAFGGSDYYDESGRLIGHSVPSVFGGEDFYGVDGERGFTVDSPLGGKTYIGSQETAHSIENPLGGEDIFGDVHGYSLDSVFGGKDITLDD